MVKKSSRKTQGKKTEIVSSKVTRSRSSDLDDGYCAGISSFRDINLGSVKEIIEKSRYTQILVILTVIGLFLRFYHIDFNSIWLDEAATYLFSLHPFAEYWNLISQGGEVHPPLFYWLEYFMLFFGNNEFYLRFIPALVGVVSIPLMYVLGKEILDRNVGIIAAALLTFSAFHIMYSQEARMYSLLLFFFILSFILYLRAMRTNSLQAWALFGIISALAFWTHFIAIVFTGILFASALAVNIKQIRENIHTIRPILIACILFILLSSPLIVIGLRLFSIRTASAPTWGLQGTDLIFNTISQFSGYNTILITIFLLLWIVGIIQIFREKKWISLLIIVLFLVSFFISYLLSYRMPMSPRYLIYLLPLFLVGIASAYKPIFNAFTTREVVYLFLIAMVVLNVPSLWNYYQGYSKDDWRGVSQRVSGLLKPGDVIVLVPAYNNGPFDYYYQNASYGTLELGASNAGDLERIYSTKPDGRILYVVTNDISAADPTGGSIAWLREHAKSVEAYQGIFLLM